MNLDEVEANKNVKTRPDMKDLRSKRNQDKADNLEREKEVHFARSVANQNATLTSINLVPRAFPKKMIGAPLTFFC